MNKLPSDRKILKSIFDAYKSDYPGPNSGGGQANDPWMLVDIRDIANRLNCTPELLFGRLYYPLDAKYRYKQDDGTRVDLFYLDFQGKGPAVRFPFLASILAGLNEEHRKLFWSMVFSVTALIISLFSLATNIVLKSK